MRITTFDRCVDYLEQISCVLVNGIYLGTPFAAKVLNRFGVTVQIAKRNELHTVAVMSHGWVVERAFTGLVQCPASFVAVELIQTGIEGALYGTRREA